MKEVTVLIVEDESIVAMELESYIGKLGYSVAGISSNGEDALRCMENDCIDIVLMDICLKGDIDGIETAELIKKQHPKTEIIFLTAHMDDYNVDRAIKLNPVAYLSKPFNREELRVVLKIATRKLKNLERQTGTESSYIVVLDDEFSYDMETSTLYCHAETIHLTKKESDLLALFIRNKNNIVDFYTIENTIWPNAVTNANTIRTLVKRLRQKLKHKFIVTVSSQGYRLIPQVH